MLRKLKAKIPYLLVLFRALLAPGMIWLAYRQPQLSWLLVIAIVLAILSDIFDGILARKWGTSSVALRIWDCRADIVFWLGAAWCVWVLFPDLVKAHQPWVWGVLILEPIPDLIYFIRFRKEGCSHTYLSKSWGLSMVLTMSLLFGWGIGGWPFLIAIALGWASQLERVCIALILPARICDIPTVYHAWLLRQGKEIYRNPLFHGKES